MSTQLLQERLHRHLFYLEQDKDNFNLLLSISNQYQQLGNNKLAQKFLDELKNRLEHRMTMIELNSKHAGLLALLYFDANDTVQAEIFSNKALTLNPDEYHGQLVRTLLKTLCNEVTIAEIDALLTINPEEGRLLFALGATNMRLMNVPAAEQAFLQASQLWPNFYENWISYGWCQILQNKLDLAEMAYQRAVKIDASHADGWGGLAIVSALNKNITQAKKWLDQAQALHSECFLADITRIVIENHFNHEQQGNHLNNTL
jgi:Tfp pilus assembly protein PilF